MSRSKKHKAPRKQPGRDGDARAPQRHDSSSGRKGAVPELTSEKVRSVGMFSPESIRETVESVVIAFILAFLFRTFEAEAFVIPTGSMAPTLMGRHKDMECPECGFFYRASASQEVNSATNRLTNNWTMGGTCPMCRFPMDIGPNNPQGKSYKSYSGDRILVEKFPYQFRDPERFEVCVFKFPDGAKTNYIKRICGLPNETIRIQYGDLYVKPKGEADFTIARKENPRKLLAVLQPVYDTAYVAPSLVAAGLPQRWINEGESASGSPGAWSTEDHQSFRVNGQASGDVWLRYQHVVPTQEDWLLLREGTALQHPPRAQLISDFTAYNTKRTRGNQSNCPLSGLGIHWVGDLALECGLNVESDSGEILVELVEGGRRFRCTIDVATGIASLSIDGDSSLGEPKAETKLNGAGRYQVRFANVDDQLRLWIDGSEIEFDLPTTYEPLGNHVPTRADLLPAGIASRGVQMVVSRLRLLRDLYYIADKEALNVSLADYEFRQLPAGIHPSESGFQKLLSTPELWSFFSGYRKVEFELDEGEFLALGDNSGESKDSRLWARPGVGPEVPRDLLIGKALFIYWPHSEDRIPGTGIPFPFFPNFKRMHVIR